jgi:peptide chain release factor subunit 1
MQRAFEVGQQAERVKQVKLVQTIVSNAGKGRGGVIDLEDTLNAVHDGRVHSLVIREGYRAPGYRCQGCGYLTSEQLDTCPFCENEFDEISDAVELAVRRVMRDSGEVEVIRESEEIEDFKKIGALLRY